MDKRRSRVSIGLPVFDGEAFVGQAIESTLAQSFEDFELVISDNASTDGTEDICQSYAAKDRRIRYYRNQTNLGASKNFNRVFELSLGTYFKWESYDDVIAPNFLSRCVEILDEDASVVLAFSRMSIIDEHGGVIKQNLPLRPENVNSRKPQDRFANLIIDRHGCFHVWGVMQSEVLRQTRLMGSYIGCDRGFLAEIGLRGRYYIVPENLFFLRHHSGRSVKAVPFYQRGTWFDPELQGRVTFPTWRLFREYCSSVKRAPLSGYERLSCGVALLRWIFAHWNWAKLAMDAVVAVEPRASRGHLLAKEMYHRLRKR